MPESAEITRAAERGYLRAADIARLLGVARQRGDQLTHMPGFPKPKVIAGRRMWERTRIEAWADEHWWGARPWRIRGGGGLNL